MFLVRRIWTKHLLCYGITLLCVAPAAMAQSHDSSFFKNFNDNRYKMHCNASSKRPFLPQYSSRSSCLRVAVRMSRPYVQPGKQHPLKLEGVDLEILRTAASRLNFDYSLTDVYDAVSINDSENNAVYVVNLIEDEIFDLGIGGIASHDNWGEPVPVSYIPYLSDSIVLLQRRVVSEVIISQFNMSTETFTAALCVLALAAATYCAACHFDRIRGRTVGHGMTLGDICRDLLDFGNPLTVRGVRRADRASHLKHSMKCLLSVHLSATTIMVAVYTAVMTGELSVKYNIPAVETVDQLSHASERKVLIASRSTVPDWFVARANKNLTAFQHIWARIAKEPRVTTFVPQFDAVRALLNDTTGTSVYIGYQRRILSGWTSVADSRVTCDFYVPDTPVAEHWKAFVVSKRSMQLRAELTKIVDEMRSSNLPEFLYHLYAKDGSICQSRSKISQGNHRERVLLSHLRWCYVTLAAGYCFSVMVLAAEFISHFSATGFNSVRSKPF